MNQNSLTTTSSAGQWLAAKSPQDVEGAVASLLRSHGVSCLEEREITFSTEGPNGEMIPAREPRLLGYTVHGEVTEELADRLEGFLAPAEPRQIEQWLAELSVISAKRVDDDFSEELRLTAYTRRLLDYPADMVRHVLLVERWRFFPTWQELGDKLDQMKADRERVIRTVQRRAGAGRYEPMARETKLQETEEERRERCKRMAEVANETLKAMRRNMGVPMKGTWK